MNSVFAESQLASFGWLLLHSFWQAGLAYLLLLVVHTSLRGTTVFTRYVAACSVYVSCCLGLLVTFVSLHFDILPKPHLMTSGLFEFFSVRLVSPFWVSVISVADRVAPYLVWAWATFSIWKLTSIAAALYWHRYHERLSVIVPAEDAPPYWQWLCERLTPNRSIDLAVSGYASAPATIGWNRATLVVPLTFFTGLSPEAAKVLIAHELAHICQQDYLVNGLQKVMNAIFVFNPLMRLLSSDIDQLREECSDVLAVSALGCDRATYIKAFEELEDFRQPAPLTLGSTGGSIVLRVKHLVRNRNHLRRFPATSRLAPLIAGTIIIFALMARSGASQLTLARATVVVQRDSVPVTIYRVLKADRANFDFLNAVEEASILFKDKRLDAEAGLRLAKSIAEGAAPDALLRATTAYYRVAKHTIPKGAPWRGGSALRWDDIAQALYQHARQSDKSDDRKTLTFAALLLAAQERITPGGYVYRLVFEPDFPIVSQLPAETVQQLRLTCSIGSAEITAISLSFMQWESTSSTTLPADIHDAIAKRPYMQWLFANFINRLRQSEPSRAAALTQAARDGIQSELFDRLLAD